MENEELSISRQGNLLVTSVESEYEVGKGWMIVIQNIKIVTWNYEFTCKKKKNKRVRVKQFYIQ